MEIERSWKFTGFPALLTPQVPAKTRTQAGKNLETSLPES